METETAARPEELEDVPVGTTAIHRAVDRELRMFLAERLAADSGLAEAMHIILAVMAALIAWPSGEDSRIVTWVAAIILAAVTRYTLRRRTRGGSPERIVVAVRTGVVLLGTAWGGGLLLVAPGMAAVVFPWIAVIFAGLIAGATLSLLADPRAYYALIGILIVALMIAVATHIEGQVTARTATFALIPTFTAVMVLFYRRAHAMLVQQFRNAKRVELSERAVERERLAAQRLSRIIDITTDHVAMAGSDGRLRYLNRAWRQLVGIGPEEDVSTILGTDLVAPRLRDEAQASQETATRDGVWRGETALIHRDGHEIPVSVVMLAERRPDGRLHSMTAIARDISEQVSMRDALAAARDAAQRADAAKSAFLANTSHEIRTPLNGILGLVELLQETPLTPEQRRSVELIASSGDTLLNTINDVLDLSKIEASQLELERAPFDLHQVVHSSARLFAPTAAVAGVELVCDIAGDIPTHIVGDSHRLRQVLSNLVSNAVKFTSSGEIVLRVRRTAARAGRTTLIFGVRDTGIGIAPHHVTRIFEPFQQVDTSTTRGYGGTGLGLSIARRLVELMGGTIGVTSTPGVGTEFSFTIECAIAEGRGTDEDADALTGIRALVVDDRDTSRGVVSAMLASAGAVVEEASDVDSAVGRLRDAVAGGQAFRVVVSDVQMPGRDGFALVSMVRAIPDVSRTAVVLLRTPERAGDDDRSAEETARRQGIDAMLTKPVSRPDLVAAVRAAVNPRPSSPVTEGPATRPAMALASRGLRILIAEDNAVNQVVADAMLRKRGHEVSIVSDGRAAVERVLDATGENAFDVVLMDVQMPELDGVAATREIRRRGMLLPIVALTADVTAEERERCMAAGMNDFLSKPFRPENLFAMAERWGAEGIRLRAMSAPPVGADAPVDLERFRETLTDAGLGSLGDQLLGAFLDDSPARLGAIGAALADGDGRGVARAANVLRAAASNIRAGRLESLLESLESAGSDGKLGSATALLARIEQEYERVEGYLREGLGTQAR
jgi:two-component system sensor histidine kinase/response regulator